jgi:hypothetical protein
MMDNRLAPIARAASMNSWSLTVMTEARATLAKAGTVTAPTDIIKINIFAPNAVDMHMASSMAGIEEKISVVRIIMLSVSPPKYPAIIPKTPPMESDTITATIPTVLIGSERMF